MVLTDILLNIVYKIILSIRSCINAMIALFSQHVVTVDNMNSYDYLQHNMMKRLTKLPIETKTIPMERMTTACHPACSCMI